MRKILSLVLVLVLLCTVAGCNTKPNVSTGSTTLQTDGSDSDNTVVQQPMYSVSLPVVLHPEKADDGTILFHYIYQNISLIGPDPEVADKVIIDFLNRIDKTASTAEAVLSAAKNAYTAGNDWNPYLCQITYAPERIDQSVLSLYGEYITYRGTPHPESSYSSVTYDLITGEILSLKDILTGNAASDTLCNAVINYLKAEKEALHLYEGFELTVKERFSRPLEYDQAWHLDENGLQIYFPPYEIAPYSSGVVAASIPYSDLVGLMQDAYFPAELETATGTVCAEIFNEDKASTFTQFSEVILNKDSEKILLFTDKSVYNLRLSTGTWSSDATSFTTEYTVFAASSLTPGDAVMIEADYPNALPTLLLTYESNGKTMSAYISVDDGGTVKLTEK